MTLKETSKRLGMWLGGKASHDQGLERMEGSGSQERTQKQEAHTITYRHTRQGGVTVANEAHGQD